MELSPIGLVHSSIRSRSDMPIQGVSAEVEIFQGYAAGLDGIEENSHLILVCWLHQADRNVLKAVARKISNDLPEKGVFSLRSPARPNPLSISVVQLLGVREGRYLLLEHLDLIDGTPVIDIKPYQPGWDCVFSATGHDRTEKIQKMKPADYRASLIREAANYHGEVCTGVATGVRIAEAATRILDCDLRRPDLVVTPGADPCTTDALIGITGATPGNRRFRYPGGDSFVLSCSGKEVVFRLLDLPDDVDEIFAAREETLFECRVCTRPIEDGPFLDPGI
ncbi:tRNA (N6-threonylcarbamoyladenosine(37)-N6)-methyltransferase TrmO [Methanoculleus sp.]|uniref:tRNA (N6-threonylcarbamoyladenosine(37)-N6)-methyltransferase TrmO n=1 Tax=Methanoculleus sp. TaxID=90427 RepID=UPI0026334A4F|nr:tRNA (N6-threonylcarbamoyladenosine(37)-N6)-methyltransferase TrmO [Methanoculleus sp.]MDI6867237.1 tRNA (N6-threonylcarbamoyladenosine(37)-N6)-methyltransferase TrmO [Methanoculleus sp.]